VLQILQQEVSFDTDPLISYKLYNQNDRTKMSDDDDDLFADTDTGGDTDDLIASSKAAPIATPKKIVKKAAASGVKRKRIPGAL
jgi:hypothetical protein